MPANLKEHLANGLRPESYLDRNAPYLQTCTNLRPTEYGLKDFHVLNSPVWDFTLDAGAITKAWPFPQLFRANTGTYMLTETGMYLVTEAGAGSWTFTDISALFYDIATYGLVAPRAQAIPAGGGPWQLADSFDSTMLCNGADFIIKAGYYSATRLFVACDGQETCTDGTFDAGPGAEWALSASFTDTGGEIRYAGVPTPTGTATQVWAQQAADDELVVGKLYEVVFNITDVAGAWTCAVSLGGTAGATVTTGGKHTQYIRCGTATVSVVVTATGAGTFDLLDISVIRKAPSINTAGMWKEGRMVLGGFDEYFYANSDWPTFLATYAGNMPGEFDSVIDFTSTPGSNWVWVTSIGGADINCLLDSAFLTYGVTSAYGGPYTGYGTENPFFIDLLRKNQVSMRPLPWQGTVLNLSQLGDSMIAYGSGGATALIEGAPLVGTRKLLGWGKSLGIAGRCAVGGGVEEHIVLDESGDLWRVQSNLVATRLGYSEYLSPMLSNDVIITHDSQHDEYYIADGVVSYLLNKDGLCRAPRTPTSVSFAQGGLVSIYMENDGTLVGSPAPTDAVEIVTQPFYGDSHRKVWEMNFVTVVSTDTDATGWQVAVDYRFSKGAEWQRTDAVTCDERGTARVNVSGTEFRIVLSHADRTLGDLDNVELELSVGGKRSIDKWLTV